MAATPLNTCKAAYTFLLLLRRAYPQTQMVCQDMLCILRDTIAVAESREAEEVQNDFEEQSIIQWEKLLCRS